jgi:hypothetical protein
MTRLRSYQAELKAGIMDAWRALPSTGVVLAVSPARSGKCLGKDTPVLMWDGTIEKVQDVRVGDYIMGPDSKARKVLSVCRGVEELWRVTPLKGDPYVVNASHILSLKSTAPRKNPRSVYEKRGGEIINMNVVEFAKLRPWGAKGTKRLAHWCRLPDIPTIPRVTCRIS